MGWDTRHPRRLFLRANRRAAESLGLRVEDVEGKSTFELYPAEAEQYHRDDLEVMTTEKAKSDIVERYQIESGEKRWVRTDKIPYRNEAGKIIGVIVFAVDITEQQQAQEALQVGQRAHLSRQEGRLTRWN